MSKKRPRTVSISLDERGQTTQDFAVGIGIFLLAMAFVFSYVPTLLTPFSADTGTAETAQADRIAATILEEYTTETEPNALNESKLSEWDEGNLESELGLRSTDRLNVTVVSLNESVDDPVVAAGDEYDEKQSTASAGRIVTVEDSTACDPACRLVVRVW